MYWAGENGFRIRPPTLSFIWLKFFKKVCEKLLNVCVENARINLALEGTGKKYGDSSVGRAGVAKNAGRGF